MKIARLTLGLKFSIAVTTLIGLTMLGVASLIINFQKDSLRQNMAESNLAMTRNLAHDAAGSLLVFDPLRLDELVNTVPGVAATAYALIADDNGVIVAHTKRSSLGLSLDREHYPGLSDALAQDKELVRESHSRNLPVKEFSVPITIGSKVLGLATIGFSMSAIDATIESRLGNLRTYIYLITGIMLLVGIGGAFLVSDFLTKPLRRLKDRMIDVQTGNLNVEVDNPRIVKCWERLDCDKDDCPSYGKVRCWATAGTFCHGAVQGAFAQKIGDCRNCVVYQESCGDEIQELVEVFNQMLKDLKHNLKELEKVNTDKARMERLSALGEMATTVAHETKNPLNSIRLATSYLKKNFQGEILSEFLSIIEEEVMRLNEITSDFLGFSKPAPLKIRTTDMNALVKSTVELVRQEATDRNIEVIILTDEHVPPVPCDFSRMKQALLNLLLNAIDASAAGNTINITTEAAGARMTLSVQDTGRGIPPEEIENIFKPFYTTKTRGSGLGLAIVDRIVKEHKGEITVESTVGKGTKFTILLPVYEHAGT
jgi:two-component system, NtrC family, sensor histidine kinase HydH